MTSNFHATILTLFPEAFPGSLGLSLAGKALRNNIWSYDVINIRDFGVGKHKKVDEVPCGGGNGLIMRPDVVGNALDYAKKQKPNSHIYYPSPRGIPLNQQLVQEILAKKEVIILCGRFEGIDERVIEEYNVTEISIGDYILSGGEVAALAVLDCIIRLIPGVLVNSETLKEESFEVRKDKILLEHPLYTKPIKWRNREVPEILLSGNHKEIDKWKEKQALKITEKVRPDLLKKQNNK
ncbi:MAG: tRNA (guanosine(37)-N1)-methyltransferase TrmD [Rickettsiaceae bacterium]|nr:tRNA (guanosine(37)-N1)-methyltransferase TrmD [Rickettsiaceae bacterium]